MPEEEFYSGWFGVRCILLFRENEGGQYEERITLWRAQSHLHAHELGEREARRYAETCGAEFLEYSEAYFIDREIFELDAEVFSSLRESDLAPADYIGTFYSTGKEHGRGGGASTSNEGGELEWYGVRCLFWWSSRESRPFEERITLWKANSPGRAVELAVQEAGEYVEDSGLEHLSFSQVYGTGEGGEVREGMVVFSLLRDSHLSRPDYLAAFFDTGQEYARPDID